MHPERAAPTAGRLVRRWRQPRSNARHADSGGQQPVLVTMKMARSTSSRSASTIRGVRVLLETFSFLPYVLSHSRRRGWYSREVFPMTYFETRTFVSCQFKKTS